jgi:acetolactate synthase small subunit
MSALKPNGIMECWNNGIMGMKRRKSPKFKL